MSTPKPRPHPPRDPAATRQALLRAAFEEIHEQGFRNASLDRILERAGCTKGALYHHIENKTALGYAVIDEVIWPEAEQRWAVLADPAVHPVDALVGCVRDELTAQPCHERQLGCPINNLVQEMSTIDEGFRTRLVRIQDGWRRAIAAALARGQRAGQVRADVDAEQMAALLVAAYEGCTGLAKSSQDPAVFTSCMQGLIQVGETLRATTKPTRQ
jgi:TetR/AcrR family transcriptional repressor of nem operon